MVSQKVACNAFRLDQNHHTAWTHHINNKRTKKKMRSPHTGPEMEHDCMCQKVTVTRLQELGVVNAETFVISVRVVFMNH